MKTPSPAALALSRRIARYLWREWIRPLAIPLLLITAGKSALADINYVPSGSMQPTLLPGDVVFINKLAYDLRVPFTFARLSHWADPARGDVVVCFSPDAGTRLVKRVVGLPGDMIEMRNDVLFLNGERQSYTRLALDAQGVTDLEPDERGQAVFAREHLNDRAHAIMLLPRRPALRNFGPLHVPDGNYFMLGDHRNNSHDSRFFGVVPRREIIGEVKAVVASADLAHALRPRFGRFFTGVE
jgi:signal peptidase I